MIDVSFLVEKHTPTVLSTTDTDNEDLEGQDDDVHVHLRDVQRLVSRAYETASPATS